MRGGRAVLLGTTAALLAGACVKTPPPPPAPTDPTAAPSALASAAPSLPSASATAEPEPVAAADPGAPSGEDPPEDPGTSLPKGFVGIAERGVTRCGNLGVELFDEPGKRDSRFIRVTRANGSRLYEAHGRDVNFGTPKEPAMMRARISGEFCGDLTGDGVPELGFTESTMGAHCCYTRYVVSMTEPPKRLLMWDKGDAGTDFIPVHYAPGSLWQLEDRLVFSPPFDVKKGDPVLSYASTPLVPVVFSLVKGEYVMTSLSFPEAYRKQRDDLRAECAKQGGADCGIEMLEWIDGLAIGDWLVDRKNMKDAELRATLTRLSTPTLKALGRAVGSLASPVFVNPKP
jgi:hypothetical protein